MKATLMKVKNKPYHAVNINDAKNDNNNKKKLAGKCFLPENFSKHFRYLSLSPK